MTFDFQPSPVRFILLTAVLFTAVLFSAACAQDEPAPAVTVPPTAVPPTSTPPPTAVPYPQSADDLSFITVAVDAPSRYRDFTDIDEYGRVTGFDADLLTDLAARSGIDVEFVVTPYDGMLSGVAEGEFDAAVSALIIPDTPAEGIAYTEPYLEIGQVLVVRADEKTITGIDTFPAEAPVGVQANTAGEETARRVVDGADGRLRRYDTVPQTLQALIDRDVDGVIIDHDDAEQYVTNYYQQIKIAGGETEQAWMSRKTYGIAVAAGNRVLQEVLNEAIAAAQADTTVQRLRQTWLIPQQKLAAGESLIGTLDQEFVIGLVAPDVNMDPAADPDPISWELKTNTMSGLLGFTAENELVPLLATDFPTVSADGLEYTFRLREGLTFTDGSPLTAEDVRYSLNRVAGAGNFLVNAFLKDSNVDGFADADAVQVVDEQTVTIRLDVPTAYFPTLLATPPYAIVSDECYPLQIDPANTCGGIGPYTVAAWSQGEQMRLQANEQWPGTPPTFENVQVRFYTDPARMRRAFDIGAIDLAWSGLQPADYEELRQGDFVEWAGAAAFKSYLVFEHDTSPWNNPFVRRAAAHAVDRAALADLFAGNRQPLFSPVPDQVPGHAPTQPRRDLDEARRLLATAGYTPDTPLPITIDYVSDGRYSTREAEYAAALEAQLEETNVFQVTLEGSPYDAFRQETATCQAGAFLLGWPPSGQPPYYIDPAHWINYFIFNTDTVCSNYESVEMETAVAVLEGLDPNDRAAQAGAWTRVQQIWAQDYPTLDLTQETPIAFSLPKVTNVQMDAMGLLRYETLDKE